MKRINFKTVTLLFFLLLLFFNLTRWFAMPVGLGWVTFLYHHPALFYAPLTGFYLILSFFFAFFPCSKFHTRNVVCKGDAVNPCVSITFDDGPDSALTPVILDTLKKHRVPATFFLIGHQIAGNESLIRRIDSEGHEMGNHSFDHSGLWDFRSAGALRKDILKTEEVIEKIVNKRPRYFRPPYGVINPMVEWAMAGTRYLMIGWSVRSLDTIIRNEKKLLLRITGNLRPGDIILLHDNRRITAAILEELILIIRSKGFRLVSLSELIKKTAYV